MRQNPKKRNRKTASLFPDDPSDWNRCRRVSPLDVTFDSYALAYKTAAEAIISFLQQNSVGPWQIVFPLLFLYRHYVELRLKSIILDTSERLGTTAQLSGHKLDVLLGRCIGIMNKAIRHHHLDATYREVRELLADFITFDAGSITFRYPEEKNGSPTIGFEYIRTHEIVGKMASLASCLELMRDVVSELPLPDCP